MKRKDLRPGTVFRYVRQLGGFTWCAADGDSSSSQVGTRHPADTSGLKVERYSYPDSCDMDSDVEVLWEPPKTEFVLTPVGNIQATRGGDAVAYFEDNFSAKTALSAANRAGAMPGYLHLQRAGAVFDRHGARATVLCPLDWVVTSHRDSVIRQVQTKPTCPANPKPELYDGLTAAECMEIWSNNQRSDFLEGAKSWRPRALTALQKSVARNEWRLALATKVKETETKEHMRVTCDPLFEEWE